MEDSSARRPGLLSRLKDSLTGEAPVRTFQAAVNAYGKLPIYKDFISAGLTDPAAREFRTWLDRGFSHRWSADEACRETEIARHGFLLRLPETGAFAAGWLWGSRDEGGLRRFPFTLFLTLPEGHRAAEPASAPEYLGVFERQADAVARDFGPGGSLAAFYRAYRGAGIELPVKPRERILQEARAELAGLSTARFAESLFGAEASSGWLTLLARLERASAEGSGERGVVRLPLGGALARAREVQFWLLRLSRRGAGRSPVRGFFFPAGSEPGRASLLFRDLKPEDIFLLHPTKNDNERAGEPAARPAAAGVAAERPASPAPRGWDGPLAGLIGE